MTAGPSPSPFDDFFQLAMLMCRDALEHLHRWERRIAGNPLAVRLADHYLVELRRR